MERGTMFTVGILTISDKGSAGKREDASGLLLHQLVDQLPGKVMVYQVIPDEKEAIQNQLISFSDRWKVDLVLTTGGTGVSPRDVTPEATMQVLDRLIPGMGRSCAWKDIGRTPRRSSPAASPASASRPSS